MTFKLRQYSACIIDIVEDFLEEHNINIENDEKQDSDNPQQLSMVLIMVR